MSFLTVTSKAEMTLKYNVIRQVLIVIAIEQQSKLNSN